MNISKEYFLKAVAEIEKEDYKAALDALIFLHDNPDNNDPSSEMFRRVNGFSTLAMLAKNYEPAADALLNLINLKKTELDLDPENLALRSDYKALRGAHDNFFLDCT